MVLTSPRNFKIAQFYSLDCFKHSVSTCAFLGLKSVPHCDPQVNNRKGTCLCNFLPCLIYPISFNFIQFSSNLVSAYDTKEAGKASKGCTSSASSSSSLSCSQWIDDLIATSLSYRTAEGEGKSPTLERSVSNEPRAGGKRINKLVPSVNRQRRPKPILLNVNVK